MEHAVVPDWRRLYLLANRPGELGGVQRVVRSLAAGFAGRGFDVTVVGVAIDSCGRESGSAVAARRVDVYPQGRLVRRLRRLGVRVGLRDGVKFERVFFPGWLLARWRLRQMLRRRPGHVVAMDVFAAETLAGSGFSDHKYRRVAQFHNSFDAISGSRDERRLLHASTRLDLVLALTEQDAAGFAGAGFESVSWMPNPLPFGRKQNDMSGRPSCIVSMGRLEPHKGFEMLVRAWARCRARAGWELRILGDGPDKHRLGVLAKHLKVDECVTLAGNKEDVQAELLNAQILVLASDYEDLPMVLLEAMSQFVACLATDSSPGVRQLLRHGKAGELTPVGDVDALAGAIDRLISDEQYRQCLAASGYEESSKYDLNRIVDRWIVVLADGKVKT